jgi:ABC-type sugar transport system substrate-binding protein
LCAWVLWFAGCAWGAADPLRVTFINPGRSDETYWVMVSAFMQAAARSLQMELEIIYLERNHLAQTNTTQALAKRARKPDWVLLVNEKLSALPALEILDSAGINTLLVFNDLSAEQKQKVGTPRKKLRHWRGTITPNNTDAGRKIAEALLAQARKLGWSHPPLLALSGSRTTPASVERKLGLDQALAQAQSTRAVLLQEFWAEFEESKAYNMTVGALRRYPHTQLIWAANDPMALGALRAARESGRTPGSDILLAGLNWSPQALQAVAKGELVASVGGHFATGGWSLVVLHDLVHGVDFAQGQPSAEMHLEVFDVLDASNLALYQTRFGTQDWSTIPFRNHSRALFPKAGAYDFSWASLLRGR